MAIRDEIMAQARQYPEVAQVVDQIEQQLGNVQINPEELTQAIRLLEHVLQVPEDYPKVRAAAIMEDMIDPDMLPAQFDIRIVLAILIALYELQDRLAGRPPMPSMGGGALGPAAQQLAAAGRGGDSELVHVNPREKAMLEQVGGQGSVNPNTGLREYKGGFFKTLMKIAIPAVSILVPGIGTAIGGALGFSGTAAGIVGGAALGAAGSAATGGNVLQGATLGGLGGGLGSVAGKALGITNPVAQNIVGSGLVGAGAGALTGQGALKGAGMGVLGGAIGEAAKGLAGSADTALASGVRAAGAGAGNALTVGYKPSEALGAGALAGIAGGLTYKPSTVAVDNIASSGTEIPASYGGQTSPVQTDAAGNIIPSDYPSVSYGWGTSPVSMDSYGNLIPGAQPTQPGAQPTQPGAQPTSPSQPNAPSKGLFGTGISPTGALTLGLGAASLLSGSDVPTSQMPEISESQAEYMNLPTLTWDWTALQKDAAASGQTLGQYVSNNWNVVQGGKYNVATAAEGGALNQIKGYAKGSGTGRSDSINAKLSDGEYVIDAETVSLLGDGSNEAGARALDRMRAEIRKQKGKKLAKGKISPNAKSPLAYIKEMV